MSFPQLSTTFNCGKLVYNFSTFIKNVNNCGKKQAINNKC